MKKIAYLLITVMLLTTIIPVFSATADDPVYTMKHTIDFEMGGTMGFEARNENDTSILTVTDEIAYEGDYSLLTTGRSAGWHGPSFKITDFITPGEQYTISVWVHAKTPERSNFRLSQQTGQGTTASYHNIIQKVISPDDGWVELTGTHVFANDDYLTVYIENDVSTAEFYIDNFSFSQEEGMTFTPDLTLPSLAEVYKDYFLMGSAYSRADLGGQRFELIKHHFNVMTAGNDMKPDALSRARGEFHFERADVMIDILEEADILSHGHTLVWHSQSARWLNRNDDGSVLTRAQAKENMQTFINTVAKHFAGRVISWDVVNEAFQTSVHTAPSGWKGSLRRGGTSNDSSAWFGAYENGADTDAGESGADYIYDAFVFTRLADPGAILYYNDFNETEAGKREVIARMTEELNEIWKTDPRNTEPDRLLIEGLGLQAHYWTDNLDIRDVEDTINRWKRTGAEISITELDIPMGSWNNYKSMSDALEKTQAQLYAQLFRLFRRHSDSIARVTIWGIDDGTSWRSAGSPLLFESDGTAKLAFYAVMDPEGFLAGDYNDVRNPQAEEPPATPTPTPAPETPEPIPTPGEGVTPPPQEAMPSDDGAVPVIFIIVGAITLAAGGTAAAVYVIKKRKE